MISLREPLPPKRCDFFWWTGTWRLPEWKKPFRSTGPEYHQRPSSIVVDIQTVIADPDYRCVWKIAQIGGLLPHYTRRIAVHPVSVTELTVMP